ncbi:MAG: hypothetical protein EA379_11875 [Phycisphaerales bacterium]|nr:MAG: hypothetical protein EA379_11875 [Phycisphaerales bacterium]
MTSLRTRALLAFTGVLALSAGAGAAEKLIETVPGPDFNVGGTPVIQNVAFTTDQPVTGVGFTARWTAVVADNENGIAPWSLDLGVRVTAPDGAMTPLWKPIGGDVTIADYPLQDYRAGMFESVDGQGEFEWRFTSIGPPWVAGLRNVQYHLTTTVPDVVEVTNGSTLEGPTWNRPFFIAGISGLGPVVYQVRPFRVSVSGGYRFHSVVSNGNNFTFLYQGDFNAATPLANLLDYGLGNGNAPNGTPQGTSLIEAMLFEGVDYYFVNSQWDRFSPGTPYTNTITGPGELLPITTDCPGDANGDGVVDFADLSAVLSDFGQSGPDLPGDVNGDGEVNFADLSLVLANFGVDCN